MSVKRGEWNHCIGFLGIPGAGKSVAMVQRAMELRAQTPCYIVAHDLERALPEKLPGGRSTGIVRHKSIAAARVRLKKDPGGIHAIDCADAEEVVRFAHELGLHSLSGTPGERGPAPPVLVLVDEVTNCREMGPSWLGPTLQPAVTARRHRHCGILWTAQQAGIVNRAFLANSTELHVFRLQSEMDAKRLIRHAGFAPNSARAALTLKKYQCIKHAPAGFGDDSSA